MGAELEVIAPAEDESLARQLLATTRDGVAIFGPTGRLVMWNAAAQAITGWTRAEAASRDLGAIPAGLSELREGTWVDARRFAFHLGRDAHTALLLADRTAQIELTQTKSKLQDVGLIDPTTGLPGRSLALDHLGRSLALAGRDSRAVGVLAVGVRPSAGAGSAAIVDAALAREIARRLTISTRSSDYIAHSATWDFVVVLTAMSLAADSVMVVAARLLLALAQPFAVAGPERTISTAIGISRGPEPGVTAATLLDRAERARQDARDEGAAYRLWRSTGP